MKSKFKLLKLPKQCYITNCAETVNLDGINSPDWLKSFTIQEKLLIDMINFYNEYPEDPYAQVIAIDLLKILAVIVEFYQPLLCDE